MRATKDPALHVFGLDNEDPKLRNKNMIDLRGAILCGESNVLDEMVAGFIKEPSRGEVDQELTELTLEPGRLDQARHDGKR